MAISKGFSYLLRYVKRTKEIGIRKALGVTVSNGVMLLNREFVIVLTLDIEIKTQFGIRNGRDQKIIIL